jgi:protease-4
VSNQTVKSGSHKDIGSPLRRMTDEESAILQQVLDEMHARFAGLVRERRPQFVETMGTTSLDGRILTASQARDANLVDDIGYLDDAIAVARRRAEITEARVVMYRRPGEFAENIYSRAALTGDVRVNLLSIDLGGLLPGSPRFMYLWLPAAE